MTVSKQSEHIQYGALPWRRGRGGLEILLVTTLNTKRWIVPKGWPLAGHAPAECAEHEALEEAGLLGKMQPKPLGSFPYEKSSRGGDNLSCNVLLFAMEVKQQRRLWPEKKLRETRWCSVEEALERVSNPGLRSLIQEFAEDWHSRTTDRPDSVAVTHEQQKS